jgi:Na+-transporting methylmalonyl-CoA/oxaloacetate decarboxylase gamma subunit
MGMGLVFGFLTVVLALVVLGLWVIGAIWESVRVRKDFKKLEQQIRRWQSQ